MKLDIVLKNSRGLESLYDEFIQNYTLGNFTEGVCEWNGDDALMGPESVAHLFKKRAEGLGYTFNDYKPFADELEEWVEIHLGHLESKFL